MGEDGDDLLLGGAGNDILLGGKNQDRLFGNEDNDLLRGQGGNDNLDGGPGQDKLLGNGGSDTLDGGVGNDTMIGGGGNDRFRFLAPDDGVDTITDFSSSKDKIEVDASTFGGNLNPGVLPANQFVLGIVAQDSDDRFIYDQNTGDLFYDEDGRGGNDSVTLAILSNQAELVANDIVII